MRIGGIVTITNRMDTAASSVPPLSLRPYLDDGDCQLYHGDVLQVLRELPTGIAQTCVTSPPFYGLRDYGTGTWTGGDPTCDHRGESKPERKFTNGRGEGADGYAGTNLRSWTTRDGTPASGVCGRCGARRIDEQIGLEATIHEYVQRIVEVFQEVWRVLRPDGTCWIELGDSYNAQQGNGWRPDASSGRPRPADPGIVRDLRGSAVKPKDLIGVPWTVALALRDAGWYLRSDIVWSRPNPMPESVTDRPTKSHSYIFLLSKQPRYYMDMDAIREPGLPYQMKQPDGWDTGPGGHGSFHRNGREAGVMTDEIRSGRNARSVWTIPTQPFPEAHFATYPEELVRRCILAATSQYGECSACGAPWIREVDVAQVPDNGGGSVADRQFAADPRDSGRVRGWGEQRTRRETTTTGWSASCTCNAATRTQLVLDPFCGSGTTNLVARNHARRSIGIDLSAAYLEIAARRLAQQSLLSEATP